MKDLNSSFNMINKTNAIIDEIDSLFSSDKGIVLHVEYQGWSCVKDKQECFAKVSHADKHGMNWCLKAA